MTATTSKIPGKLATMIGKCVLIAPMRSLNKFTGGAHWSSKNKHWQRTKNLWLPLLRSDEGLGFPSYHGNRKRMVKVERWLGKGERLWDDENVLGGDVKCINDALVRLEWLKDDSPAWRELITSQRKRVDLTAQEKAVYDSKGIRTVISVYDLVERP